MRHGRAATLEGNTNCIDHRWLAGFVAILVATAVLFTVRLSNSSLVSEEFRWAEVAREMRLTRDYLHPTINGRSYYDKPLGSYWLIVVASHFTGGVSELSARLPAAIAGWLGVLLIMLLALRLFDPRTALVSGAVLGTSFAFVFFARRATADMETTTGVLVTLWWYLRNQHRSSQRWVVALWLLMAAVSLTKGLLGFALPTAVLTLIGVWNGWEQTVQKKGVGSRLAGALRVGNRWLFNRWTLLAIPLSIVLYLVPFAASSWQTGASEGLAMVYRENVQRFFNPHNHQGSIFLYVGVVFALLAPWSVFLPAALAKRPKTIGDRFTWSYFFVVFVFFSLAASRRSYYLLPILPAAALLIGRVLSTPELELPPLTRRLRKVAFSFLFFALSLAVILVLPWGRWLPVPLDQLPPLPMQLTLVLGWIVAVASLTWMIARGRDVLPLTLATVLAAQMFVFLGVLPEFQSYRTRTQFVAAVKGHLKDDQTGVALCDATEVMFDLELSPPVAEYATAEAAEAALQSGQARWVIVPQRHWPAIHWPIISIIAEKTQPWEGDPKVSDKMMLLGLAKSDQR